MDTYTMPMIESDRLTDTELRSKLIDALHSEQLWGFDTAIQALQAILTHPDFPERWETSDYTADLAFTYRARKLLALRA